MLASCRLHALVLSRSRQLHHLPVMSGRVSRLLKEPAIRPGSSTEKRRQATEGASVQHAGVVHLEPRVTAPQARVAVFMPPTMPQRVARGCKWRAKHVYEPDMEPTSPLTTRGKGWHVSYPGREHDERGVEEVLGRCVHEAAPHTVVLGLARLLLCAPPGRRRIPEEPYSALR